jgi:enediyne biosynthesis protein E4
VSPRKRLIQKTLILCSLPVLVATAAVVFMQRSSEAPYVAGAEQEGITRSLDRSLQVRASPLRFTDVTEAAGIRFEHFPFERTHQLPEDMGSGAAWGDFDGDGLPDLFLVNFAAPLGVADAQMAASGATDRLYRNRGDGTFEDVTESSGVGVAHRGMGANFVDYDGDGDLDLFVTSYGENILWENLGDGTFRDVTEQAGLTGEGFWSGSSWADFDLDGDLDLYVCGYVYYTPEEPGSPATRAGDGEVPFTLNPSSYPPRPNRLYVNRGDGTFEERAAAAGVLGENGRSLGAAWADFDEDGLPDLYVANDVSDNGLYRNRGDGTFENASYTARVADYRSSMGIAVGDWDGDLDLDLFLSHWVAQENALYSNLHSDLAKNGEHGRLQFSDDADRVGLGQIALDLVGWGTGFVDFDHDGWLDLFLVNGSTLEERQDTTRLVPMHPHLYWNRGPDDGFFEVGAEAGIRTDPPGVGRGAAFADYDGDGDTDVLITRHGGRARLLRNDSKGGHWIGFRVRATSGHPSALGTRIVVHAGGRSLLREVRVGPSYLSQNDSEVLVGIGDATRVESIEIRWPDGSEEVEKSLAVDRRWRLEQGREPLLIAWPPAAAAAAGREAGRAPTLSEHTVVAHRGSELSHDEKKRFWQLASSARQLFIDGRFAEAAEAFAEMSALDPRHEDALYYRGNSLLELGRYAEADECWKRLIELNPKSSRAWVQLGVLHTMPESGALYDLAAASEAFETAHGINREHSGPLVLWGETAVARGRLDEARGILESAYRMNPNAASALYLDGYIAGKRGEMERSRALLRRAREALEKEPPAHGVLGEGDARTAQLAAVQRRAAQRGLFAQCLETLRAAPLPLDPDAALSCVDRRRAELSASTTHQGARGHPVPQA